MVDKNDGSEGLKFNTSHLMQTAEEVARAFIAAASAATVQSTRPSVVYSSGEESGSPMQKLQQQFSKILKGFPSSPEVSGPYNPEVLTTHKRQWSRFQLESLILGGDGGGSTSRRCQILDLQANVASSFFSKICNAVTIARLLNATLVIPKFLYSNVWLDKSQFGDIYQEDYFINYLKSDIRIVKELPVELQSLDLEAIGSLVNDTDVMKEAKPSLYVKQILPILLKNKVVHFVGFGNRLSFDPIPFDLQRLRCRCNFHALRFVRKIQETGALLVERLHGHMPHSSPLQDNLLGHFAGKSVPDGNRNESSKYLAVHLRFEIDMVAYSMCYFGGGKDEVQELETYRQIHFPALTEIRRTTKLPSAAFLRSEGKCPLAPEEAVLMLAAIGFKRSTNIYVAGAEIYGGRQRMAAISHLYPALVTKESLLSPSELEPFRNFSSQLAALDFIACAAADAFAMTDSGSQFSSLVQGYRMYYGGGDLPTIRPNKRRLASILVKNATIEWNEFEARVKKLIQQTKQVHERPVARSVFRHPRCPECMCRTDN